MARCGPNLLRIIIAHLPKHLFTIYHFKEYRLRQEILLLKQLLLQTTFCNHWRKLQILIFCALTIPLLDGCAGDCRNWNYYCKNSARRLNRLSRRKVNWIAFFNWTLCSLWICSATDHCRWITRIPADERYMLLKYIVWKKCCSSRCGQMWFFGSVRMMNCLPDPYWSRKLYPLLIVQETGYTPWIYSLESWSTRDCCFSITCSKQQLLHSVQDFSVL